MNKTGVSEPTSESPLITFALVAYNQEKYIREAVEGAFSQTYSPLEIIMSDDCSSDSTFEIMQQMAASYAGPHSLVLNRNDKNQGIGGHINTIMEIVKGELIVVAAGDDISMPERVSVITQRWLEGNRKSMSLHSGFFEIDTEGSVVGVKQNRNAKLFQNLPECISKNLHVTGATHAWAKEIFDTFGPLRKDVTHEDRVIPLRAMLLGNVEYIDMPLVKYRISIGISNMSFSNLHDELYVTGAKTASRYYIDYLQKMQDLVAYGADDRLLKICSKRLEQLKLIYSLANKADSKSKLLIRAIVNGAGIWFATTRTLKYSLPFLIRYQKSFIKWLNKTPQIIKH